MTPHFQIWYCQSTDVKLKWKFVFKTSDNTRNLQKQNSKVFKENWSKSTYFNVKTRMGLSERDKLPPAATKSNSPSYAPEIILPNRATLPNRAHVYRQTDGQTDGQGDSSIPPLTLLRGGGGGGIINLNTLSLLETGSTGPLQFHLMKFAEC